MIELIGEKETMELGKSIARHIPDGMILAMIGDLGSGKTTLSKAIIKHLMGEENVPSPTFNIVNEYRLGGKTVYHFDFYRLEEESELYNIGFDDYLADKKAILLIEWADKFLGVLPKNYVEVVFEKQEGKRRVEFRVKGRKNQEFPLLVEEDFQGKRQGI